MSSAPPRFLRLLRPRAIRSGWRLAVALGLLIPALAAAKATAPAPRAVLEASSSGEIRFRIPFEAPEWVETPLGDRTYRHLEFPGLLAEGAPGEPRVPTILVRVALPPGGEPQLSVTPEYRGRAGGLRFPPSARWVPPATPPVRDRDILPEITAEEPPGYAQLDSRPFAEILSVGVERGLRIATVALRPVEWDPATGQAAWVSALTVSVTVPGARAPAPGRPRPDRAAEAVWNSSLVNPEDAPIFRAAAADTAPPPPGPDGIPPVWFGDAPGWLKIAVTANGMYRLDRSALEAAGVPVSQIDPRTLRLYSGPLIPDVGWAAAGWDTVPCAPEKLRTRRVPVWEHPGFAGGFTDPGGFAEIAIWVRGEEDGTLDAGDDLVFYGLGPDNYRDRFGLALDAAEDYLVNPYTDRTVYWLSWSGSLPGSARRMTTRSVIPGAGPELTETTSRLHVERNTIHDGSLYTGGYRWEGWYWEFLSSNVGIQRFFIDLPQLVPGSTMDAVIRFWGAKIPTRSESGEPSLHHLRVTVNGQTGPLYSWGGTVPSISLAPYDVDLQGVPAADPSDFRFLVPEVTSTDPFRLDQIHLTWMDIAYRRQLDLAGAPGELEIDSGTAGRTLRVRGVPAGELFLFDVSDFRNPRRLTGVLRSGAEATLSVPDTSGLVLAAATAGTFGTPASVVRDTAPETIPGSGSFRWLRDRTEPLDYVIIAYDPLAPEAELLAEWRREHLYPFTPDRPGRARVVRISDIMDEFAWGMWDPMAIRTFLEYVYRYYGNPETDDPLTYCLFLGDSTNDPRDYGNTGIPDLVPSWEDNRDDVVRIAFGPTQYVSDDPFAQFDGIDVNGCPDVGTDLAIGRITATNRSEAREILVNKVIAAEKTPIYGPWRTRAILVADDVCQGNKRDALFFAHMNQTEDVAALLPPLFDLTKIYLFEYGNACIYASKPEAKRALLDAWREGAWFVNYIGHGADVVWADEHVLDLSDTPILGNGYRLPLVGSFSCSVGKFSNPSREGMAEAHLRQPGGGSLVSAAATQLTSSAGNSLFNQEFLRQLFPDGVSDVRPVGLALIEAKRRRASPGGDTKKYVCLGDPATRLNIPEGGLDLDGPLELDRGTRVSVGVTVPGGLGRSGTVDLVARDALKIVDTDENGGPLLPNNFYSMPGATLYRGRTEVTADQATGEFTVPASLRGGSDGRIRAYAWGADWDAAEVLYPVTVGGVASSAGDTLGPNITFSVVSGAVAPGEEVEVAIEDASGINLTRLFDFRSIQLKVFDRTGLEQYRQDLTEAFAYELGSSTRGTLSFPVPDLEPAPYQFTISATDNFNNRSQVAVDLEVGSLSGAVEFEEIPGAYPNPFDPTKGPTRLLFNLTRSSEVTARVYTVSGRLVRKETLAGSPGSNVFVWDGRDEARDLVANGVYLVQLSTGGAPEADTRKAMERVVVLR